MFSTKDKNKSFLLNQTLHLWIFLRIYKAHLHATYHRFSALILPLFYYLSYEFCHFKAVLGLKMPWWALCLNETGQTGTGQKYYQATLQLWLHSDTSFYKSSVFDSLKGSKEQFVSVSIWNISEIYLSCQTQAMLV